MRVLAITNVPVPYRVDFFNELAKNMDLTVLYEQSIEQQKHRDKSWFAKKDIHYRSISLEKNNKISYWTLIKEINKAKNDIILMMGYSNPTARAAILWLKLRRIPYILTCDGALFKKENQLLRFVKHFLIKGASMYLSTGEPLDRFLIYYGAKENKIRRIPFTTLWQEDIIDKPITVAVKESLRNQLGITEKRVILSVGQFIYRKGYDILLNACKGLDPSIGIYIVGGDATDEYIRMKEENHLDHVHFVGFKIKDELKKYYMAADVFVLPTREDIWGLVINEALAYGLPVITTDRCIAGLVLVKDGENGHIIKSDDIEALKTAIEKTVMNDITLEKMSINSLAAIQEYTIENMAQKHNDFFKEYETEIVVK